MNKREWMPELMPCPFCGGPAEFSFGLRGEPQGIWCNQCRSLMKYTQIEYKASRPHRMILEQMAERWNRRKE